MDLQGYWDAVLRQDAPAIRPYFCPDARIRWHNTNESFSVEEFIRANCQYPGSWAGTLQRVERMGELTVTVTNVYSTDRACSFHVVSFLRLAGDRIASLDEYWGDDGPAPQWRQELGLGSPIL